MGVGVDSFHLPGSGLRRKRSYIIVRKFNLDDRLYKMYDKMGNAEIELSLDNQNRVEVVCALSRQDVRPGGKKPAGTRKSRFEKR